MKPAPKKTPTETPRRPPPLRRRGAARVIAESVAVPQDEGLVEHPDGFYWLGPGRDECFGPFENPQAARAHRDRWDENALTEGESVQEAEAEIGIADWIDAETGAPAEGQSPPHLDER